LTSSDVAALSRGGYLHDVGKIGVPDASLLKTSRLTPDEFEVMKQHTVTGDRLCGDLKLLRLVRPIVRSHHERTNGSGYPDGLVGEAIPRLAQIMGIVDVYDALTTERVYRSALTPEAVVAGLESDAQRGLFQPDLVREFARLCRSGQLAQRTRRHSDCKSSAQSRDAVGWVAGAAQAHDHWRLTGPLARFVG
jgi:putative two-component system response regulator